MTPIHGLGFSKLEPHNPVQIKLSAPFSEEIYQYFMASKVSYMTPNTLLDLRKLILYSRCSARTM